MKFSSEQIISALKHVVHPAKNKDIVELGMVNGGVTILENRVTVNLTFERENDPMLNSIVGATKQAIKKYVSQEAETECNISFKTKEKKQETEELILHNVKNIIAIASGKGGVGKSTVASNLSVSLARQGFKVGLLDADIFGPSMPKMFAVEDDKPDVSVNQGKEWIVPVEKYGVKLMSIGFFVDPKDAVVWRGAMANNALKQLIFNTMWGELDYLLIDLPPGTSDIHLTIIQNLTLTGAIIVSTPQDIAIADVIKAVSMFRNEKIAVPIIGIIENMAWFTPKELPDNKYYIFGKNGAKDLANRLNIKLLAEIPLVLSIRESGDNGLPTATDENSATTLIFDEIADIIAEKR